MKTIQQVTTYVFFKPVNPDSKYYFIRTQTNHSLGSLVSWGTGYENHLGLVSFVGGGVNDTLAVDLEKEYQNSL
jgi:hypothetical protein